MNNLTNNDLELITQLLDGELSSEQAAEVTKMIESSPEMQAEMDRLTEISDAIRKDDEQFVPPKKAKDNVFLALGIPLAVSAPSLTSMSTEIANIVSMVAAVSASLLTFTMFYSLNDVDTNNVNTNNNVPIVSSYEKANNNNIIIEDDQSAEEASENQAANSNISIDNNTERNSIETSTSNFRQTNSNNRTISDINSNSRNTDISSNKTFESNVNSNDNSLFNENVIPESNSNKSEMVSTWNANIITTRKTGILVNNNIFLEGKAINTSGLSYTRDYLTIIRTKATSNNLNSGLFDVSFLTNYFTTDLRGVISAGLSWYDQNSNSNLKNPIFVGGGLEYTPTFTSLLANSYFDTFVNAQVLLGSNPSYRMEAGLATTLGGLTNFPIVIGYSRNYVRDYQFIQQELNEGLFVGTEISF